MDTTFVISFNQIYCFFSPSVANLERKRGVQRDSKTGHHSNDFNSTHNEYDKKGSEIDVLGYRISVLNLGIYVATSFVVEFKIKKYLKARN